MKGYNIHVERMTLTENADYHEIVRILIEANDCIFRNLLATRNSIQVIIDRAICLQ